MRIFERDVEWRTANSLLLLLVKLRISVNTLHAHWMPFCYWTQVAWFYCLNTANVVSFRPESMLYSLLLLFLLPLLLLLLLYWVLLSTPPRMFVCVYVCLYACTLGVRVVLHCRHLLYLPNNVDRRATMNPSVSSVGNTSLSIEYEIKIIWFLFRLLSALAPILSQAQSNKKRNATNGFNYKCGFGLTRCKVTSIVLPPTNTSKHMLVYEWTLCQILTSYIPYFSLSLLGELRVI